MVTIEYRAAMCEKKNCGLLRRHGSPDSKRFSFSVSIESPGEERKSGSDDKAIFLSSLEFRISI